MNALQVLHLFLNPFAGRANRQQFLFFVLIFLSVLLWLEVAMNAYDYDKSYDSLRFIIGFCGFYFVIVGFLRRLRDNDLLSLENFLTIFPVIIKCVGVFLIINIFFLSLYLYLRSGFSFSFLISAPVSLAVRFNCTLTSSCPQGMNQDIDLSGPLFLLNVLFGLIFFAVPLLLSNNRFSNRFGPPPVGFNFRTMLKGSYPKPLIQDEQSAAPHDPWILSNPWIGRMNQQQFILGTALCAGAMFLGTSLIPEPALVYVLNICLGFMIIIFVSRRLNDQYDHDGSVILRRLDQIRRPFRYLFFMKWFAGLYSLGFIYLAVLCFFLPPVMYFLYFFFIAPVFLFFKKAFTPLLWIFAAFVSWLLLGGSYYRANKYGLPPIGMDFRTTLPGTYPDAAAEQFDVRERELQHRLERAKAARKAKTGGASPYIEFKGRG